MSTHIGICCNKCRRFNFSGRRYKCLWCKGYNLCQTCYEGGLSSFVHTSDHPVQCVLTVFDFALHYAGEDLETYFEPQSLTCPYCGKMGFTKATLVEHLTVEHPVSSSRAVACPVCPARTNIDYFTYDLVSHLDSAHNARGIQRRLMELIAELESDSSQIRQANMTNSSGEQMSLAPSSHDAGYLTVEVVFEEPRPCEPTTEHPNHLRTMSESSSSSSSTSSLFGAETTTDYVE